MHKNAMGAALAMQAAARQGKAWEMHDIMFANYKALTRENLEKYAETIGLDLTKFKADMDNPALKEEVLADQKIAKAVGATGTPAFYINGRKVSGAKPFDAFKKVIDEEIKKADELLKNGTPLSEVYEKRSSAPN